MNWGDIGQFCLYPMVIGGLAMIGIMIYRKQYKWGFFFSGVFGSVLLYEGMSYFETGKTISTQYGLWIQADPFWAIAALVFMAMWMIALFVHLLAYGLRKKN